MLPQDIQVSEESPQKPTGSSRKLITQVMLPRAKSRHKECLECVAKHSSPQVRDKPTSHEKAHRYRCRQPTKPSEMPRALGSHLCGNTLYDTASCFFLEALAFGFSFGCLAATPPLFGAEDGRVFS